LNAARISFTATLLPNGKVLVAGGMNNVSGWLSGAELYDPATGIWAATGSMNGARAGATATLLPNGKVLVVGGQIAGEVYLTSAELYDSNTGTWTATGSLSTASGVHATTLLPNGKVLLAGGFNQSYLSRAELYDPASGTWTATGSLSAARSIATVTAAPLLPDGKVLLAGGINGAELYDSASGTWTVTGAMSSARYNDTDVLLPNGQVLVAGGQNETSNSLSSAELYGDGSSPYQALVQSPINADETSVFTVRRGVVPVKFTLTDNGAATCALPPATIAVTRTAGGTLGEVNESLYAGSADSGSNFRINSCQYIYNLNSGALGAGTYRVDIRMNNQIVGSAVFQLK
jgi:hypothetical protein